MAKRTERLNARLVATLNKVGLHADGGGLYLKVDASGAKRWSFIYQWQHPTRTGEKKRTEMGLGRLLDVTLAEARDRAAEARKLVAVGTSPIEARDNARNAKLDDRPRSFGAYVEYLIPSLTATFRNAKHQAQWLSTLKTYCVPIWHKALDAISTVDVLAVLKPIWLIKPETASRLRGRIERVLDAAKAEGLRQGDNPAAWRGNLKTLLPKHQKLSRGHHAAMPYRDVPELMRKLEASEGTGALALRLLILNASRTSEIVHAEPVEFDLNTRVWVLPAARMKSGREHRVPLSEAAIEILRPILEASTGRYVFGGNRRDQPISSATMTKALVTAGGQDFTVHGFRSSFRDWVSEETDYPDRLAEAALAHVIGDKTEAAYRRGDALEKRRAMMTAWAKHCVAIQPGNVVPLTRRA